MAKAVVSSPQFHNLKNQILGTRIVYAIPRESQFIHRSIIINNNSNIKNVVHARRLPSVSVSPLPSVPHSCHPLRTCGSCVGLSSPSLLPLRRSRTPYLQLFLTMSSQSHTNDGGPTNPTQESAKTVKCVIKGRVQGVFYRNWTVENANLLGLKGWVRNRRDGSVEALFSGKPETVDEMLQRCRRGPPDAMVTALEAVPCNEDPGEGFQRKQTV